MLSHYDNDIQIVVDDAFRDLWFNLNFQQKLLMSLDPYYPLPTSLFVGYQLLKKFVHERPNTLIVKFEDLVGKAGGGSDKKQREAIIKIAEFIGHQYSEEDITRVTQNLFGSSPTFRKGKIGSWNSHFDSKCINLFSKYIKKLNLTDILSDYGYEQALEKIDSFPQFNLENKRDSIKRELLFTKPNANSPPLSNKGIKSNRVKLRL